MTSYYSYTTLSGEPGYPLGENNPNSLIQKSILTRTQYTYNAYGQLLSTTTYDAATPSSADNKTTASYTYSNDTTTRYFGALLTETDNLGITTRYFYDARGQLQAVINTSTGTGICYTYDLLGNITSVMPATWTASGGYVPATNKEKVEYEYNDAIHLRNGKYGLVEIKLGGDKLIEEGAKSLKTMEAKIDTDKMNTPSFLMVLTGTGDYAYRRQDGVYVIPVGCLKD